jgi:hypothetical protein
MDTNKDASKTLFFSSHNIEKKEKISLEEACYMNKKNKLWYLDTIMT